MQYPNSIEFINAIANYPLAKKILLLQAYFIGMPCNRYPPAIFFTQI